MGYYILGALAILMINLIFACFMNQIALDKGHDSARAFVMVLLFGIMGMLYVIALPDQKMREQQQEILVAILKENTEEKE